MMMLAVTLHNIPEGMAVGVVYAGFLSGNTQITAASALALSLGIAIQNFPEGAIISMPLRAEGERKGRAFLGGVLSGVVEPIGAVPVSYTHLDVYKRQHQAKALTRKERTHRLCTRAAMLESYLPHPEAITDEQVSLFLKLLFHKDSTRQLMEKVFAGNGNFQGEDAGRKRP